MFTVHIKAQHISTAPDFFFLKKNYKTEHFTSLTASFCSLVLKLEWRKYFFRSLNRALELKTEIFWSVVERLTFKDIQTVTKAWKDWLFERLTYKDIQTVTKSMRNVKRFILRKNQCCGSGSALIWLSWILIRIENVDPDQEARKMDKIKKINVLFYLRKYGILLSRPTVWSIFFMQKFNFLRL